jgi:hypothetical protein
LSTARAMQNCSVHCPHTGTCGLPPRWQSTDYGMNLAASVSLEHRSTEDFLLVCWDNSGSIARVPQPRTPAEGWRIHSHGEPTIVDEGQRGCQRLSSCTFVDATGAPINATVAMHLRGDQVQVIVTIPHRAHRRCSHLDDGDGTTEDGLGCCDVDH